MIYARNGRYMKSSLYRLTSGIVLAVAMLTASFSVCASNSIDPVLYLGQQRHLAGSGKEAASGARDGFVSALVKARDVEAVVAAVNASGGNARVVAKEIASVTISIELLEQMAKSGEIEYAEADKQLAPMLDKSLPAIGATAVKAGQVDGVAYDGTGVIIGIIDTGIDWRHSVFNDADGNSRIISIWDQGIETAEGFAAPSEIEGTYGIECFRKDIEEKTCPSKDEVGHGTHVAGIAAGRDKQYEGMAPGAELIVVKIASELSGAFSTSLVDAVDYIMRKASQAGKPVVINMSLGTQYGAHDGTSLLEQALDAKISEAPGRAIVASAGNYNRNSDDVIASVHASTQLQGDECRFEFLGLSSGGSYALIDIWQREGAALTFGLGVDKYGSYEETGIVAEGSIYDSEMDDGRLHVVVESTETVNPENGRKHTVLYIEASEGNDISIDNYSFDLIASGSGAFDAWAAYGSYFTKRDGVYLSSGHRYCPGDSRRTVGIPATAQQVISVASFATRDDLWPLMRDVGISGDFTPVDSLSPFSSPGPSGDSSRTGQKPEITAPGEMIISALSYDAINSLVGSGYAVDNDRRFVAMAGTSMASPHVAGAIALMLQRKPDLTTSQIETLIARNSRVVDVFPDNRWGYGIIDVAKIFSNFDATDLQTPLPVSDEDVAETPFSPQALPQLADEPPSSGSGGCALVGGSGYGAGASFAFGVIVLMIVAAMRGISRRSCAPMAVVGLLCLVSGCGGSSAAPTEANFDQNVSMSDSYIKIDAQRMIAYVSMWNAENTTSMLLVIPLKHFFRNETIQMSADNFYTYDADRATLLMLTAKDISVFNQMPIDEAIANASGAWLSTDGKVTIDESSIIDSGKVQLRIEDAEMRPLDRTSLMLNREGDASLLSTPLIGQVAEGGGDNALVTNADPLNGNIGTKVRIRGFNFTEDTEAHFAGCYGYNLPVEFKSENEIEVTISAYCKNSTIEIEGIYSLQSGWNPTFLFDDMPDVWITSLPYSEADLLKVVHDPVTDHVYMLFKPGIELQIYSISGKDFITPKPLPTAADTFDVAPDGTVITAKGNVITVVAPDGTLQGQTTHPNVDTVADLASGPGQKVLMIWKESSDVCVLDRSDMSVDCSCGLDFYYSSERHPVMAFRADRRIAVAAKGGELAVYRFEDNGSISKLAEDWVSSYWSILPHLVRDEIWVENRVYALDLSNISQLKDFQAYPSSRAERYYVLHYCNIGVYFGGEQQDEIPYSSCKDDDDENGSEDPTSVIISGDDRYLTVIWNEKIRQVDMSLINAYLEAQ